MSSIKIKVIRPNKFYTPPFWLCS